MLDEALDVRLRHKCLLERLCLTFCLPYYKPWQNFFHFELFVHLHRVPLANGDLLYLAVFPCILLILFCIAP